MATEIDCYTLSGVRVRVKRQYGPYLDQKSSIPSGTEGTIRSNGIAMGGFITDGFEVVFDHYEDQGVYTILLDDIEFLDSSIILRKHPAHPSLLVKI